MECNSLFETGAAEAAPHSTRKAAMLEGMWGHRVLQGDLPALSV